jgi:hypothetical protein
MGMGDEKMMFYFFSEKKDNSGIELCPMDAYIRLLGPLYLPVKHLAYENGCSAQR